MASTLLNVITCPTYSDELIRDNVAAQFFLQLSVTIATLPIIYSMTSRKVQHYFFDVHGLTLGDCDLLYRL